MLFYMDLGYFLKDITIEFQKGTNTDTKEKWISQNWDSTFSHGTLF